LTLDASGRLWAATSLGLLWHRDGGFDLLTTDNGLLFDVVFSIATDRDGLIWFGHDGGLSKWVPTAFTGYLRSHGLLDPFVRTINEDETGRLWLGTRSGIQIVPFDEDWDFAASEFITSAHGLIDERVYAIDFPAPDVALIATGHGVVEWQRNEGVTRLYTDADGLPVNQTQALLTDSTGLTWIGTNSGTVVLKNGVIEPVEDAGLGQAYVYRFREDDEGRIWAAARAGLFIHGSDGTVTHLTADAGLSDATFWDMSPGPHSGMWVGSNGDGLFHVGASGQIRQFTHLDGLADNFIWQVLVDAAGQIWTFTNRGLSRFDGVSFDSFNRYDGLLHMEGGATGTWESHDGTLWFASADGLMRYNPDLSYPLPGPPQTILERVELDGKPITPGAMLPFRPGTIDFHYAALSFRAVTDLRYRYRLRGISPAWSEPVRYRPITFASLGSGDYVFEVQAILPGIEWDDAPISSFAFTVQRAFWETFWFRSLVVLSLIAVVLLLMGWQARRGRLYRRELELVVQERTRELEQANRRLKDATITDPLTGLHNRRFLLNQITKDIAQTLRAYSGASLFPNRDILFMMCDLDHFKSINDTHGHLVGDFMIKSFADLISKQLRESDYMVRWGGEEFLIVARNTEATRCSVVAERIMKATREARFFPNEGDQPLSCTCSIGISQFPFMPGRPEALDWEQVIDIADTAVYMAKREGRNRWVAIHGTEHAEIDGSSAEFVARVKTDIAVLDEKGQVWIERPAL
jgi:diguanylate cyclase (GGDEF)-like protein